MNTNVKEKIFLGYVSSRLKEIRISKGYTNYEHLAYEIGISRSQYGRYENGGNMKLTTLLKILNYLDVSLEDFFKGFNDLNK